MTADSETVWSIMRRIYFVFLSLGFFDDFEAQAPAELSHCDGGRVFRPDRTSLEPTVWKTVNPGAREVR